MVWDLSAHRLQPQRGLAALPGPWKGHSDTWVFFSSEILEKLDWNGHYFLVSHSLSVDKSTFQSLRGSHKERSREPEKQSHRSAGSCGSHSASSQYCNLKFSEVSRALFSNAISKMLKVSIFLQLMEFPFLYLAQRSYSNWLVTPDLSDKFSQVQGKTGPGYKSWEFTQRFTR